MNTSTRTYPPAEMRLSDADRDAAVSELSDHYQAGRLTTEEFEERTGQALRARKGRDLAGLLADLPASGSNLVARPGDQVGGPARHRHRGPGAMAVVIAMIAVAVIASSVLGRHGSVVISLWPALIGYLVFRCFVRYRHRSG